MSLPISWSVIGLVLLALRPVGGEDPSREPTRQVSTNAVASSHAAAAQEEATPACEAPEYRQFDFWVGTWRVENSAGGEAGRNRIERILDGCALQESWVGAGGGKGHSYSIYDARSGRWHQTWVDDQGRLLQLDGGLEEGRMVLEGQWSGPDGSAVRHRIGWGPLEDGRVRQVWEISRDDGESWNTVFDGIYIPLG